jgi:hypothetical protein
MTLLNINYLVQVCWRQKNWETLLSAVEHVAAKNSTKSDKWATLHRDSTNLLSRIKDIEKSFAFAFIEVHYAAKRCIVIVQCTNLFVQEK